MSNKRKSTAKSENKTNKIDSYFKPVTSEILDLDAPGFKKVKLKTRTLLKHNVVSNELDHDNKEDIIVNNKEDKKDEEESKLVQPDKEEESKPIKPDNENVEEAKQEKEEKKDDTEQHDDKSDNGDLSPLEVKIIETQELDTQNVHISSTQTQTQTDTVLGSPITYPFTSGEEEEEEDSFFDLPKLIYTQTTNKKDQQQQEEEGLLFSSTQESSLDDFGDIFNDQQDINIASLDQDSLDFSQTDDIKISSNLPDTNTSFPSSTL